ncbi:DUF3048 domain-containing protein [Candidatus Saccharibacteria bacterium]|nr:DUF3048 domain-containing protein [Candidatus Saccharibacteria bacterium]MCB9821419.1 DUF3048 domain-containing protein [Candidatus Nomurabacteria bacterium]
MDNRPPTSINDDLEAFSLEQSTQKQPRKFKRLLTTFINIPKKYLLPGGLGLILAVGLGGYYVFLHKKSPEPVQAKQEVVSKAEPEPEPIFYESPLTGMLVENESDTKRPITGIMIENSVGVRPQSGLLEAGVVFEADAEGGITRLLALYQEGQPDYIGPVRSARPYYVEWLAPFDAFYVHVGGDIAGKAAISKYIQSGRNLDQYVYGSSFSRISSRIAPHNVYTDFTRLDKLEGKATSDFEPWPRKDEEPVETSTASSIDMTISSPSYNPSYTYDKKTNSYLRFYGNTPHSDERTGDQINPKVVIAMQVDKQYYNAKDGPRTDYTTVDSGKVWVFQDGQVIEGRWSKSSESEQILFNDSNGAEIVFNRGQTWITAVSKVAWQ